MKLRSLLLFAALTLTAAGCSSAPENAATAPAEQVDEPLIDAGEQALLDEAEAEPVAKEAPVTPDNYRQALDSLEAEIDAEP
jgi:hypothetical protein